MSRLWVLCEEPADYANTLVVEVFMPMGASVAWRFPGSRASSRRLPAGTALEELPWWRRLRLLARALATHDVFILNGYAAVTHWMFFVLNAVFFRKSVGLATDTQADSTFPRGSGKPSYLRTTLKRRLLGWLFRRDWIWGLPCGTGPHVDFFKKFGMSAEHIHTFPMVVDERSYRRRFPRPEDGIFRFGYVGRLEPHKRIKLALAAFRRYAASGKTEFHIIGEGRERQTLEAEFGSVPGVRFLGPLYGDEKVAALQRLDCLVLVSDYEPWGLVVNEALTAGIPVIVSECVGARMDLVEGTAATGIVVPPDDEVALAAAMFKMYGNDEARARFAESATRRMMTWGLSQARLLLENWLGKVK